MKSIKYGVFFLLISMATACSKEDKLTFPSTYVYGSPRLNAQGVYKVNGNTGTLITGNIGRFAEQKKVLSDSLVRIVNESFKTGQVKQVEFLNSNTIKVTSIAGGTNSPVEGSYTLEGNKVLSQGLTIGIFSDDFSEFSICNEYSIISGINSSGKPFLTYNIDQCRSQIPLESVNNIIKVKPTNTVYDTISIDYVNLIFNKK